MKSVYPRKRTPKRQKKVAKTTKVVKAQRETEIRPNPVHIGAPPALTATQVAFEEGFRRADYLASQNYYLEAAKQIIPSPATPSIMAALLQKCGRIISWLLRGKSKGGGAETSQYQNTGLIKSFGTAKKLSPFSFETSKGKSISIS